MSGQSLVGAIGVVESRVRGGSRAGEIRVVVEGLPHHYLAFCPDPVEVGQHVVVIHNRGGRQVDVEPWPLADVPPDPAPGRAPGAPLDPPRPERG